MGGGFGGVKAALELANDSRFAVTLLTDHDNLRYYPTLYHNATGGSRANSVIPFNEIFADKHLTVFIEKAVSIDRKAKKVIASNKQEFAYDTLILGLGVITNFFGIKGLQEFSYGIKTNHDAEKLKAHLHQQLRDEHEPDLNYIIVGAGPTGIELAGALPGYIHDIMERHGMTHRKITVTIVEAMPRLLPRLPKDISRAVRRRLRQLGVSLLLGQSVEGQTADGLIVNGQELSSHTVIWTAGVTNNPFFSDNHFVIAGRGKVAVDTYLQTEPDIFVIGDNANTPYSGLAQTALYDGRFVARNLKRRQDGKDFKSYVAKRPITVIPAGPYWAAVVWGKLHIKGMFGWLLREAADFIAFRDYEAWPKASEQFMTEFAAENTCKICAAKANYENA